MPSSELSVDSSPCSVISMEDICVNRDSGSSSYRPATTSSFSVIQLISIEMTLHGEESTLISEEGVSRRRNGKFLT